MTRVVSGAFWMGLYMVAVVVPVILMLAPPLPSGRAFLVELSMALGFVGLTQIGIQFVLIARFKQVTAPYGIDIILQYHRKIAIVAVVLILLHPLILLIEHPARIVLFNPLQGTYASRFGLLSLALLLVLVVLSLKREQLGLNYERWRISHALLGVLALIAAQAHVSMAGLYINTTWKQVFWIGFSVLLVSMVCYLRLVKPAFLKRRPWRVVDVHAEGPDTYQLTIEPEGHPGMSFEPGQFAWVKLQSPWSVDEHPYSFASSAERPRRISFGIKIVGDFSSGVPQIQHGTCVYLDGPHGAFSIDRFQAPGFVFIAGGIGITPFMSFLHTMDDRRDPRPATLIYGGRTADALAFRTQLDDLQKRLQLDVVYVLEEPPEDWEHEEGIVTADLLERRLPRERFRRSFLLCGPPVMLENVQRTLREYGVPQDHIQLERFDLV
jgi:predicted ferric reductase